MRSRNCRYIRRTETGSPVQCDAENCDLRLGLGEVQLGNLDVCHAHVQAMYAGLACVFPWVEIHRRQTDLVPHTHYVTVSLESAMAPLERTP